MGISSLTPLKSCSNSNVDKSPSATKLIEPKIEGEGPVLHPFHIRESLGGGDTGGGLPDLRPTPLC